MGLEIKTRSHRNLYIWSTFGLISFSAALHVMRVSVSESFSSTINALRLSFCSMGFIGLLLTIFSCFKMYMRVGIIPGFYHSTVCVPSYENNVFSFKIPKEFYFAVLSGLLSVLFFSIDTTFEINKEIYEYDAFTFARSIDFNILRILKTYAGLIILIYCYFHCYEGKHEYIGILMVFIFLHYEIWDYESLNAVTFVIGGVMVVLMLGIVWSVKKASKALDFNTISIIISAVQLAFGAIALVFCLCTEIGVKFQMNYFIGGVLNFFGIYSIAKSNLIEISFILMFPSFCNLLTSEKTIEFWICCILIALGYFVMVAGDIPFKFCSKYHAQRYKSPLHSPLL